MQRVLVLADDECIRVSCAEVLRSLGMEAVTSPAGGAGAAPDVVLVWDGLERDLRCAADFHPAVPVVVCTYDHRRPWPGTAAVVPLPFDARRLASALLQVIRAAASAARATVRAA
jgi:CheY-like chemotaxis protein